MVEATALPVTNTPGGSVVFSVDAVVAGDPTEGISLEIAAITGGAAGSFVDVVLDDVSITVVP